MISFYEDILHYAIQNFGKKSKIIGGRWVRCSYRADQTVEPFQRTSVQCESFETNKNWPRAFDGSLTATAYSGPYTYALWIAGE
jgi:hypothetical protein